MRRHLARIHSVCHVRLLFTMCTNILACNDAHHALLASSPLSCWYCIHLCIGESLKAESKHIYHGGPDLDGGSGTSSNHRANPVALDRARKAYRGLPRPVSRVAG